MECLSAYVRVRKGLTLGDLILRLRFVSFHALTHLRVQEWPLSLLATTVLGVL